MTGSHQPSGTTSSKWSYKLRPEGWGQAMWDEPSHHTWKGKAGSTMLSKCLKLYSMSTAPHSPQTFHRRPSRFTVSLFSNWDALSEVRLNGNYMPGTVPITSGLVIHVTLTVTPGGRYKPVSPLYRRGNWGTQSLSDLPMVSHLVNKEVGIRWVPCWSLSTMLPLNRRSQRNVKGTRLGIRYTPLKSW